MKLFYILKKIFSPLAWLFTLAASGMVAGLCVTVALFYYYSQDLPNYDQLANYDPAVMTRVYTQDGQLLAEYAKQRRIFMPLPAMPKKLLEAFIAAEDKNFYQHDGIDFMGIARAVIENVKAYGSGKSLVGGSTITQQVVKNFLLSNEKSFERKIKEAILSFRISQTFSKDEILELYLNEIYLGNGAWGVAAAAQNYFNKPLEMLRTEEMAMLAALPKAPRDYNPEYNYNAALERRNYVIRRMQEDSYLNQAEAQRLASLPIILEAPDRSKIIQADFFTEEVRRNIAQIYGAKALYEGGMTVHSTLDVTLQKMADTALRNALVAYDRRHGYRGAIARVAAGDTWSETLARLSDENTFPLHESDTIAAVLSVEKDKAIIGLPDTSRSFIPLSEMKWARRALKNGRLGPEITKASDVVKNGDIIIARKKASLAEGLALYQVPEVNGALVVIEPQTGRVLALSGGYSFDKSEFNRATQARRQPGSAFKPFVYLSALENGFTPATLILDGPVEIPQGPGKPLWRPQNYGNDFLGPTSIRVGLEKSRNTMTVRLAQMVGLSRIIHVAKRFGLYEKLPKNFSMVLGAQETTLLRLVAGYAMLANGGKKIVPSLIERIDDKHGNILYRRDTRECRGCRVTTNRTMLANATPPTLEDNREQIADERVVYQVISLMEGVVQRGTATKAKIVGKPLAGKTGTTNDSRDAWFVGFSPDLVAGVYIGYDNPRSLGEKETGGRVALPAFVDFMQMALKNTPIKEFEAPTGIRFVTIDRATGMQVYPGLEYEQQQVIKEAFLEGGHIFKPINPDADAEDLSPVMASAPADGEIFIGDKAALEQDWRNVESPWERQDSTSQWQQNVRPDTVIPGAVSPGRYNAANPYQLRRRDASRRYTGRGAAATGTGGIY